MHHNAMFTFYECQCDSKFLSMRVLLWSVAKPAGHIPFDRLRYIGRIVIKYDEIIPNLVNTGCGHGNSFSYAGTKRVVRHAQAQKKNRTSTSNSPSTIDRDSTSRRRRKFQR